MSNSHFPEVATWFRQSIQNGLRNIVGSTRGTSQDNTRYNNRNASKSRKPGQVFLVGSGPGDAELLTLKAYRLIQQADVILFDWLVGDDILALFPKTAQQVFVGKKCGSHSMDQGDICRLMLDYSKQGKQVVRLKGGDPAIFARVAEECGALEDAGIEYQIVPGITAASGASAYAGIPLTHRECAQSVRFVTARLRTEADEPNWNALVAAANGEHRETLVFYMGLRRLDVIAERLVQHGLNDDTAVAVIEGATTANQRVVTGTLADIHDKVIAAGVRGPAISVVGEVVARRYNVMTASHAQHALSVSG